jgi:signal transduction histidine kinase
LIGRASPDSQVATRIDRDRVRQILLNLLNNAQDAAGQGGQISVALEHSDGWADVIVSDNGPGVPEEDRERVFEPFYTTKEKGCGLGLSLVKRFAEEAGGTARCESKAGRGARFRVRLPEKSAARGEDSAP